jgi:hypothetical protein
LAISAENRSGPFAIRTVASFPPPASFAPTPTAGGEIHSHHLLAVAGCHQGSSSS